MNDPFESNANRDEPAAPQEPYYRQPQEPSYYQPPQEPAYPQQPQEPAYPQQPQEPPYPRQPPQQQVYYQQPPYYQQQQGYSPQAQPFDRNSLPENLRPLSAWAYFGLRILFCVPVVGFVFLIVFSCSSGNLNRRSFARSYWCMLLIVAAIVLTIFLFAGGAAFDFLY